MLNNKRILNTHREHNLQFILVLVLAVAVAAIGYFLIFINKNYYTDSSDSALTASITATKGVAFDWRSDKVLNNYTPVTFMPDDWSYVSFEVPTADNGTWGLWLPTAEAEIGAVSLEAGKTGKDVLALKTAINHLQPVDNTDEYYFEKLNINEEFDAATVEAVKKLQKYFDLDETGIADLLFQYQVYKQLVEPPTYQLY